eukprot:8907675-Pyramimonas_sp.AAC.1
MAQGVGLMVSRSSRRSALARTSRAQPKPESSDSRPSHRGNAVLNLLPRRRRRASSSSSSSETGDVQNIFLLA